MSVGQKFYAGETIVLQAWMRDQDDDRFPMNPQPSSVAFKVLSEDEATVHAGPLAASLVSEETGTATAGQQTATTLKDTAKDWSKDKFGNTVTNRWKGKVVKITGGTGAGQERYIVSNTADTLTIGKAWTTNPDGTSTYAIHDGLWEYEWDAPATLAGKLLKLQAVATLASGKTDAEKTDLYLDKKVQ